MKKIVLSAVLLAASLSAYEIKNVSVNFKAFKTYAKIGVGGTFDKVQVVKSSNQKELQKMLLGTKVTINTTSVNSSNAGRDKKLVNNFFNVQGVSEIDAKIVDVKEKNLVVNITMNKKSLNIPMNYSVSGNKVNASGTIDLADFNMLPSLGSITKACYELHKGKTWQDVDISFEITTK